MNVYKYLTGFVLSLVLTLLACNLVANQKITSSILIFVILTLAIIQTLVQLTFFLHLDTETKPRLNLLVFLSTAGVILILIMGSIWIMSNLNYNHMVPSNEKIIHDEGINK